MRGHLRRFLRGVALGAGLALVAMLAPLSWLGPTVEALRLPLAVVLFVCLVGKLVYDTLFYDHYWP